MSNKMSLIAAIPLLLFASQALADQDVALEDLPAPVKATVQREVGGGQIVDIERDTEQGRSIFEVEFVDGAGNKWELDIATDGTLLERRKD